MAIGGDGGPAGDDRKFPDFRKIVGMDPDANWLLGPARADFLPQSMPIPFVLVLETDDAVKAFEAVLPLPDTAGFRAAVVGFGKDNARDARPRWPVTAVGSLSFFEALANAGPDDGVLHAFQQAPKRIVLSSPTRGSGARFDGGGVEVFTDQSISPTGIQTLAPTDESSLANGAVFVALFDNGIAFAHDRFRASAQSTRVQAFWNMTPELGGFLWKSDIDPLLATHVDEDAVYRAAGLVDYRDLRHKSSAWRIAHGTHVLDLAAGFDWRAETTAALKRPIIAVEFPAALFQETEHISPRLDYHLILATIFTLLNVPDGGKLVINVSLGYTAGPHDGGGLFEQFLDAVIADESRVRTRAVISAGNSHLDRLHADLDLTGANSSVEIGWVVQPDDFTESKVEIWLPPGPIPSGRISLTVTSPLGLSATISEPADGVDLPTLDLIGADGSVVGQIYFFGSDSGRRGLLIWIQPTVRFEPHGKPIAPAGRWNFRFQRLVGPVRAHAWVQRDDSIYGYPVRGRQSYFDHPNYVRYDEKGRRVTKDMDPPQPPCPVKRESVMNAIATGSFLLTAGGYRERDFEVAEYSAGGPNTPPESFELRKPDVLLPSDTSRAHPGVLAAGSRSGAAVASSGTSASAPQLARIVADRLEADSGTSRDSISALAEGGDPPNAPPLPVPRGGWGRLPRRDAPRVSRLDF